MEPEVLVLDEPTAGLDPRGVADLNMFINTLPEKYGMSVIFSTHDVALVPEVADFIYVMDKGRVVASGTVDEIFVQPDMLKSVRLDVPVIPKLLKSLKENGVDVSMAYSYSDAEAALLKAFGKRP
jgi:cobalt/nickel transport system ATP-binding protein